MFVIRHRPEGMFWIDTRAFAHGAIPCASGWTIHPEKARRFATKDDAEQTAFLECSCPFSDIEAVEVPDAVMAVSA